MPVSQTAAGGPSGKAKLPSVVTMSKVGTPAAIRPRRTTSQAKAPAMPAAAALRSATTRSKLQSLTGVAARIGADAVAIDHLPALPSAVEQDEDDNPRDDHAGGRDGRAVAEAHEQVHDLEDHRQDIGDHVLGGIANRANPGAAQIVRETGDGGQRSERQADP